MAPALGRQLHRWIILGTDWEISSWKKSTPQLLAHALTLGSKRTRESIADRTRESEARIAKSPASPVSSCQIFLQVPSVNNHDVSDLSYSGVLNPIHSVPAERRAY